MFGWCIIGTGNIAHKVMKEIITSGRHKIVSVYSRTKEKALKFAAEYKATCFDSLEKAVSARGVQGVYIATPHSAHYEQIITCIKLGKPVLCEKTFTVNAMQAKQIAKLAAEKGVYVAEAMWMRFNPVIKQTLEWVKEGEIGEITKLKAAFCFPLGISKSIVSERVYKKEYAGGALLDLGVYPVSLAQMFLGKPSEVSGKITMRDEVDFEDEIVLKYASGAICELMCSFTRTKFLKGLIEGTKGKIKLYPMFYRPRNARLKNGEGTKRVNFESGYIYQFDTVATDILDGKKETSVIPLSDTVEVMEILDEFRKINGYEYPGNIEKI